MVSSGRFEAGVPVAVEVVAEESGAQGEDVLGPADIPEHAGVFDPLAHDSLATGFHDARADEEAPGSKLAT